ncbi:GNAT family N-acetyltransferase [Paenibacillus lentus]|uniref:N-acetyltransferase n=1 Tax=Paenibacillus lentus TaxID=1338368 RepID=A0A3S8RY63_9BACL|nr:GNAT family N-acetyltransferase [Paenibacillus lentus]AZK47855.1 N-acetyltransferase [Paenibacillus lentus]
MLIDVKSQVGNEEIRELLEYAVHGDDEELARTVQHYATETDCKLYAYQEEGQYIGIIGYRNVDGKSMELQHLAVHPEDRGMGYGRGILLDALVQENPDLLIVETDEESADFFRSIGFQVTGFTKFPGGPEYFRCVYETDEREEE